MGPVLAGGAGEEFEVGTGRAGFDDGVELVGFAGVLLFAGLDDVDLAAGGLEGAEFAFDAEEDEFGDVAEVETEAATVWASIFADFVPDEVGFVGETPGFHDFEAFGQEGVWDP